MGADPGAGKMEIRSAKWDTKTSIRGRKRAHGSGVKTPIFAKVSKRECVLSVVDLCMICVVSV